MKKAVIFGIGTNWTSYRKSIERKFEVVGYVDNNWEGKPGDVRPVLDILEWEYDVIIITTNEWVEMRQQLISMGIPKEKILIYVNSSWCYQKSSIKWDCFGQHFDDLILAAIFGQLEIEKPSYIDLGANDPYCGNDTAALYQSGSRGINIEANPLLMEKLIKNRPEDINLNIGISTEEGELQYYKFKDRDGWNTFSREVVEQVLSWGDGIEIEEVLTLPVTTLQKVVEKYCTNGFPDFLDCDIEGLDYAVLSHYDLKTNGPKVICVEVRPIEIAKFDDMLREKGYFRFCRIGENNIYVRDELRKKLMHY